jgi:hypothetical protein
MKALRKYIENWDALHKNILDTTERLINIQIEIEKIKEEIKSEKNKELKNKKRTELATLLEQEQSCIIGEKNNTGWDFPIKKLGNQNPTFRYFPEPYYINDKDKNVDIVFVNINPAKGGPTQDIGNEGQRSKDLFNNCKYSENIGNYLASRDQNGTAKWFFDNRVEWAAKLIGVNSVNINVLCSDLVPWHTYKASGISDYIKIDANKKAIKDKVLIPINEIAQEISREETKCKIFVRGVTFRNVINDLSINATQQKKKQFEKVKNRIVKHYLIIKKNSVFEEFISMLTVIKIGKNRWFLFTGASSMQLPKLDDDYLVYPINSYDSHGNKLRDFLLKKHNS